MISLVRSWLRLSTTPSAPSMPHNSPEIATFAAGCFWGVEHIFQKYYKDKGLLSTTVGYTGGKPEIKNPDYRTVCDGDTGYAEAVKVVFDPERLTYEELVGECRRFLKR
jgi:peptide-methionine (S)-S-oxide reductase